jgi:hypothetical protein
MGRVILALWLAGCAGQPVRVAVCPLPALSDKAYLDYDIHSDRFDADCWGAVHSSRLGCGEEQVRAHF